MDYLLDIGPGDYEMCKKALDDIANGIPSADRVIALSKFLTREVLNAVILLWEDTQGQIEGEVAHVTMWDDGTATVWIGDASKITQESIANDEPTPWAKEIQRRRMEFDGGPKKTA
jgi:hypothetical protein